MRGLMVLMVSVLFNVSSNGQIPEDTIQQLKKGYTLIFKATDSLDYIFLKHEKKMNEIFSLTHNFLFISLELDGSGYFMINIGSHGSGNPVGLDVYNKSSAKQVFSSDGYVLYEDTLKSIIVFDDQNINKRFFTLYNLNTNKYNLYKKPLDFPCVSYDCWDSTALTSTALKITYKDSKGIEKSLQYKRLDQ